MPAKIYDLEEARRRREALAMECGVTTTEIEQWDRLLLVADHAWSYRDADSLAELMGWAQFLSAQVAIEASA